MKKIITKEIIEDAIYKGKTAKEVAQENNCAISTVCVTVKKLGLKLKRGPSGGKNHLKFAGKVINGIKVQSKLESIRNLSRWKCICPCGKEFIAFGTDLNTGKTRTCGCRISLANTKSNWQGYKDVSKTYWSSLNVNARQRGKEFKLTIEYIADLFITQNKRCALSGIELSFDSKNCTASLDRKNSFIGYVVGNVQWVHKTINQLKWKLSDKEFINFCHKVSEWNKNDSPNSSKRTENQTSEMVDR